jgi:hypothetical protein
MYTNTFILDEINKSRFSELVLPSNEIGVYLIRIRLPYENKYTYKVGKTTKELAHRIKTLEDEFHDCNGEIILLFYGKSSNINAEKDIHTELKKKYNNKGTKDRFHRVSHEVYDISCDFYNEFEYLLAKETNGKYFKSERYHLLENNTEYYEIPTNMKERFAEAGGQFIDRLKFYWLLDGYNNKNEEIFWNLIEDDIICYQYEYDDQINKTKLCEDNIIFYQHEYDDCVPMEWEYSE